MADFITSGRRITRKPHRCVGCLAVIPKGTEVTFGTFSDCGRIFTSYTCATCDKVMRENLDCGDEFGEGELIGAYPEYYENRKPKSDGEGK